MDPNSSCPAVPSPRAPPKSGFGQRGAEPGAGQRWGERGQGWLMRHSTGEEDKLTGMWNGPRWEGDPRGDTEVAAAGRERSHL